MAANTLEILSVCDRPARKLCVPQWGMDVYVRALSVADLPKADEMDRVELAVAGLCDATGAPLAWTADGTMQLYNKHAGALDLIALEVLKLTGLRPDDSPAQPVPKRTSMSATEWSAVQGSLRSAAHASSRRIGDDNNGEYETVRASDKQSQQEDQAVCS